MNFKRLFLVLGVGVASLYLLGYFITSIRENALSRGGADFTHCMMFSNSYGVHFYVPIAYLEYLLIKKFPKEFSPNEGCSSCPQVLLLKDVNSNIRFPPYPKHETHSPN